MEESFPISLKVFETDTFHTVEIFLFTLGKR